MTRSTQHKWGAGDQHEKIRDDFLQRRRTGGLRLQGTIPLTRSSTPEQDNTARPYPKWYTHNLPAPPPPTRSVLTPERPSIGAPKEPGKRVRSANSAAPSSRASSSPPQGSPSRPIASRRISDASSSPAPRGRQPGSRPASAPPAASVARSASFPATNAVQHSAATSDTGKGKGPAKSPPSGTGSPARAPSVESARSAGGTVVPADPNKLVGPGEDVVEGGIRDHWFSVRMAPKPSMKPRTARQGNYIYPLRCRYCTGKKHDCRDLEAIKTHVRKNHLHIQHAGFDRKHHFCQAATCISSGNTFDSVSARVKHANECPSLGSLPGDFQQKRGWSPSAYNHLLEPGSGETFHSHKEGDTYITVRPAGYEPGKPTIKRCISCAIGNFYTRITTSNPKSWPGHLKSEVHKAHEKNSLATIS